MQNLYNKLRLDFSKIIVTDCKLALMNTIQAVFSYFTRNVLCLWHVNKNVVTKCKSAFESAEQWDCFYAAWQAVLKAKFIVKYNNLWLALQSFYIESHSDVITYLSHTWITFFCFQIVAAFTNTILHFGSTVTFCVKEVHSALKTSL